MTCRYIGSKARLVGFIEEHIGNPSVNDGLFIDAFCGTGAVAETAAQLGWPIWLNDHMVSAGIVAAARLINKMEVNFKFLGGYSQAISVLNELEPIEGFLWRQYSPASLKDIGFERRYFTEKNAGRIDAIRMQIRIWKEEDLLSDVEECLLIADLLSATNRVANIAGTYGCFLSKWTSQASGQLTMLPRELVTRETSVRVTAQDVATLQVGRNDLVYLDPPYTKRQYAAYYHILETISLGDEPVVGGITGLRPWQDKASEYCYRTRALPALIGLISELRARRILLSYSGEGHIQIDELINSLFDIGTVMPYVLTDIGRYRPNKMASTKSSSVREYLIVIEKNVNAQPVLKEVVI